MALALAAYSAATFTADAAASTTITSPQFSPAAGDLVYLIGFLDTGSNATLTETTPTNTGTGLSWQLVVRANTFSANNIRGTLFVWRAYNAGGQTNITATATGGVTSVLHCIAIIGFTGADQNQTGAQTTSVTYSAADTTPTASAITTSQAGSWCWLAGLDWTNYRSTVAAASGQSAQIATQNPNSVGDTIILTKENPQPAAGRSSGTSVTMSLTGSTASDYWYLAAFEVIPAGGNDATATPGAVAGAATVPAPTAQAGSLSGPNYAGSAADLGGGAGSWANTASATGGDDATYATWAVP